MRVLQIRRGSTAVTSTTSCSSTITLPPSPATDATTPPAMFNAVRIVSGSPITVIVYGPVNRRPPPAIHPIGIQEVRRRDDPHRRPVRTPRSASPPPPHPAAPAPRPRIRAAATGLLTRREHAPQTRARAPATYRPECPTRPPAGSPPPSPPADPAHPSPTAAGCPPTPRSPAATALLRLQVGQDPHQILLPRCRQRRDPSNSTATAPPARTRAAPTTPRSSPPAAVSRRHAETRPAGDRPPTRALRGVVRQPASTASPASRRVLGGSITGSGSSPAPPPTAPAPRRPHRR